MTISSKSLWGRLIDALFPMCPSGLPHRVVHGIVNNTTGKYCWHADCFHKSKTDYYKLHSRRHTDYPNGERRKVDEK